MAVKKSRTGKKKKPQYGPSGTVESEVVKAPMTAKAKADRTMVRRLSFAAVGLLVAAMVLLIVAPRYAYGGSTYMILMAVAYVLSMAGGVAIFVSSYYQEEKRRMTSKVTGALMVFIGVFGIVNTFFLVTYP